MDRLNFLLVTLAERLFRPRYDARIQFLEAQIRFLRARIDTSRIVPSPNEKHEALRLGALLNHNVADVMHVVQPQTYNAGCDERVVGSPSSDWADRGSMDFFIVSSSVWAGRTFAGDTGVLWANLGS